ncbi:PKD domain-containing protein, partial [Ancylomarina sp. YFZ004]
TSTSTVVITVKNVNVKPVANAGDAQTVNEGDLVTLDASASSDVDANTTLTYSWTSVEGVALTGANTSAPSFTAPAVDADKAYTFELTVSDGDLTSTSTVVITVKNVNVVPVADAGDAQTVNEGDVVTLDASASSDVDANTTLTYAWTSVENLVLTGSETVNPSFTAPTVDADKAYTFELTVSDGDLTSTSTVVITVKNVNVKPVADAGDAQTVNEGDVVTLDASASSDVDANT